MKKIIDQRCDKDVLIILSLRLSNKQGGYKMKFELVEISDDVVIGACFPDFFDNCNPTEEQDCMPNGYPDPGDGEGIY